MASRTFTLIATVSTDNPAAIHEALGQLIGGSGTIEEVGTVDKISKKRGEFTIQAEMQGESAKELNRELLSSLRRVEKKTTLRAAWSSGGNVEQYFDYVQKGRKPK